MALSESELQKRLLQLNQQLGRELSSARSDEKAVEAVLKKAVASYMQLQRDGGAEPDATPRELSCLENLRDGDGDQIPSAFELANASEDEYVRWGELLERLAR